MIVIKIKQMKIQKIFNIASTSLTIIIVFTFMFVFNIVTVSAAKNGMQGNLCYDPVSKAFQVPETESALKACTDQKFTVIGPGQPIPVSICKWGGRIQEIKTDAERKGCTGYGGTIIEKGEPLPDYTIKTDADAQRGTGVGNQPSKSQTTDPAQNEKLEAPVPLESKDRESLVNCDGSNNPEKCLKNNPIIERLLQAINFISVGVGVIVTAMIIIGGIQYSSAGGNPQKVQAAKNRIVNAIIALVAYFFLFAFLQWLVPGGIF